MSSDAAEAENLIAFYFPDESYLNRFNHQRIVEIPLPSVDGDSDEQVNDDEIVYVDLPKDLIDDPSELCTLLENSSTIKKEVWLSIAVSYALQNKFRQALDIVKSAFQSEQVNRGGSFSKFPFHIFSAWLHLRKARFAESNNEKEACFRFAAQEVDTALTINPISSEALLARAVLLAQTYPNNHDELLEMYEKILKNDSNNVYALFGKAKITFKRKNYNLALKIFQQVLILNPTLKPDSRIGIGLCYWYLGDVKSATNAWKRSAELFPDDFTANLLIAIVNFNDAFNESLTDEEFVQKYTDAISIVAKFFNSSLDPKRSTPEVYKKTPLLLTILSSYLFSKGNLGLLIQILNGFLNNNDVIESCPPGVVSDLYFWLARSYFTIASAKDAEDSVDYELDSETLALPEDTLLNRTQQLIAKSLRFDKNNLYTKYLSGQVQFYKKNINESILIFENLIKNLELEMTNNISKGLKNESKEKLIEVNYILGLLYHEKVFSDDEEITKAGAVSVLTSKPSNGSSGESKASLITKENSENVNKSIQYLTSYLKLCQQFKESVIINANLTLAKNFEYANNIEKVLFNLEKAVELFKVQGSTLDKEGNETLDEQSLIPAELLNNIGVIQFLKNNLTASKTFFSLAWDANNIQEKGDAENKKITILYNLSRVKENEILSQGFRGEESNGTVGSESSSDSLITGTTKEIQKLYNEVLERSPDHIEAKLRSFYVLSLDPLYTVSDEKLNELDREIQQLLNTYEANLETRAFYGWFIKKFNKRLESYRENAKSENPEAKLYKDTLVKYDSHDDYSLISLGNIYLLLAREFKNNAKAKNGKLSATDAEKQSNYYIRAAQLYQKVLSMNHNNLFAAQGLAIIFSELKKSEVSLEIFKKIRDSLNDASVFINLGHVLIDVKEYSKAIECYEIAINRFGGNSESSLSIDDELDDESSDVFDESFAVKYKGNIKILTTDSRFFTLLGRAWYCRGIGEKSLDSLQNSLKYSKKAFLIAYAQQLNSSNSNVFLLPSLKFNIAFIYFQIAEFIRKLPNSKRSSKEIKSILTSMNTAIKVLEELSETENPPYPATDLKQRAVMGSNTIKSSLSKELESQEAYEREFAGRIQEGQKIRDKERARIEEEQRKIKENEDQIKQKLKEEREELQKKALEWAEELAERNKLAEAQEKRKKDKKVDEDGFVMDELSDEDMGEDGAGTDGENGKAKSRSKAKKSSRKRKGAEGSRDERKKRTKSASDEGKKKTKSASDESKKRSLVRKYKSEDKIEDSDEEANYEELAAQQPEKPSEEPSDKAEGEPEKAEAETEKNGGAEIEEDGSDKEIDEDENEDQKSGKSDNDGNDDDVSDNEPSAAPPTKKSKTVISDDEDDE